MAPGSWYAYRLINGARDPQSGWNARRRRYLPAWAARSSLYDPSYPHQAPLSDRLRTAGFYSLAILFGLLVHTLFFSSLFSRTSSIPLSKSLEKLHLGCDVPLTLYDNSANSNDDEGPPARIVREKYIRPGFGNYIDEDENRWSSLGELARMVGMTKGFYVRDWSLWLGWNNVRLFDL